VQNKGHPTLKISILCATASLLVSTATSATGIIPVLDLDFTRPAAETLKKLGIDDACIVAASNPAAFTYCREGSSTLWKYQALDLEQQASIIKGELRAATDYGRITVVEVDSAACHEDTPAPLIKPVITRGFALGMILLFLLIGVRYTYRAFMRHRDDYAVLSDASLQQLTGYLPAKALGAFSIAAAAALFYCFW
jgi:hypothetical protein